MSQTYCAEEPRKQEPPGPGGPDSASSAPRSGQLIRPSPLLRVLAGTAFTSALTMGITAVYTGVLAARLSPAQLGGYLLAMRAASMLLPFTTLAMGVAIPRHVALARDAREARITLLAGVLLALTPGLLVLAAGLAAPAAARLLFGYEGNRGLLIGALAVLLGYSGFTVFYGFYRGLERMTVANIGQLLLMGIGPAIVVAVPALSKDVTQLLLLVGAVAGVGILLVVRPVQTVIGLEETRRRLPSVLRALFRYGAPRAPGGVAMQGMLALGPFLASRYEGLAAASFLLAGLAMLRMAEVATSDFGTVILPRVAVLEAEGKTDLLRERLNDLLAFILYLGPFVSLHALVWARPLVLVWLGGKYAAAVPIVQVVLLALVPYVAFMMLRAIIDALDARPVNAINLFVSLSVTAAISGGLLALRLGNVGLAWATVIGFWLLASLSVGYVWRRLHLSVRHLALGQSVLVNGALLLPSLAAAALLQGKLSPLPLLACGAAVELPLLAACCLAAWRLKARWATELIRRVAP